MRKVVVAVLLITIMSSCIGCKSKAEKEVDKAVEELEDLLEEEVDKIEKGEVTNTENPSIEGETKENSNLVTADDFSLKDGFIEKVTQKKKVPDGYIGISSYEEFNLIRNNPNANYILMEDIVCDGSYETIEEFSGVIEGNGYHIKQIPVPLVNTFKGTISNTGLELSMNLVLEKEERVSENCGGLACKILKGASIKNCYASGTMQIECGDGQNHVGGLAGGYDTNIRTSKESEFENCYNEANIIVNINQDKFINSLTVGGIFGVSKNLCNMINKGDITVNIGKTAGNDICIGGICGSSGFDGDKIQYCCNEGNIKVISSVNNNIFCAGLIGYADVDFISCWNKGLVEMETQYDESRLENIANIDTLTNDQFERKLFNTEPGHCGGIAGFIRGGSNVVQNCRNEGEIKGNFNVGGLIGTCGAAKIINCYNIGDVTGGAFSGGLFGVLWKGDAVVEYCYNIGNIQGGIKNGSIGGKMNAEGEINYCYYLESDTLHAFNEEALYTTVKALSKKEMQSKDNWEGFDFDQIWKLKKGGEYPVFK